MELLRGTPEPISLFAHASLAAGWYIAWRLTVFTAPFWLLPGAIAAGVAYAWGEQRPELLLVAGALVALGLVAAFVASIPITNRIAAGWAEQRWGRRPDRGVWWGIFWRVLVISLVTSAITGAAQAAAGVYAAMNSWSPEVLFVTLIPYAVMLVSLVVTLRAYGWAMSTMVARRLDADPPAMPTTVPPAVAPARAVVSPPVSALAASEPVAAPPAAPRAHAVSGPLSAAPVDTALAAALAHAAPVAATPASAAPSITAAVPDAPVVSEPPAPAPVAAPVAAVALAGIAAPAPAPAPAAPQPIRPAAPTAADDRVQCPKCGLRETERGKIIGWHCKICGWRERR